MLELSINLTEQIFLKYLLEQYMIHNGKVIKKSAPIRKSYIKVIMLFLPDPDLLVEKPKCLYL